MMRQKWRILFIPIMVLFASVISCTSISCSCKAQALKTDGSNWVGHKNGTIQYLLDENNHTYTIVGNDSYEAKNLIIPNAVYQNGKRYKVIEIRDQAFLDNLTLTGNLKISQSISIIGYSAFDGCVNIESLNLGSVVSIGEYAFNNCFRINNTLTIPSSVESIGDFAFAHCQSLKGVINHSNAFKFASAKSVGEAKILIAKATHPSDDFDYTKDHVVGALAFGHLVIPDDAGSIGAEIFQSCTGLIGDLSIPNSVHTIGDSAFYDCWFLDHLNISSDAHLVSIGALSFCNCYGLQGTLNVPWYTSDETYSIQFWAFHRDEQGGDYANRGLDRLNIYPDRNELQIAIEAFSGDGYKTNGEIHVRNNSSWESSDFINTNPGLDGWTFLKDL